jgi:hypothetical protein
MAEEYRGYAFLLFRFLVLTRLTPIFDSLASSCTPFSGLDRAAALRCIAKICYLQAAILYSEGPTVIHSGGAILRGARPS